MTDDLPLFTHLLVKGHKPVGFLGSSVSLGTLVLMVFGRDRP